MGNSSCDGLCVRAFGMNRWPTSVPVDVSAAENSTSDWKFLRMPQGGAAPALSPAVLRMLHSECSDFIVVMGFS